jgi:hypothetical protein
MEVAISVALKFCVNEVGIWRRLPVLADWFLVARDAWVLAPAIPD